MRYLRSAEARGTLLLDTLTAMVVLVIVFAVTYPNYIRSLYESKIAAEAAQLQTLGAITAEYGVDHSGAFPPSAGYPTVATSLAGTSYITTVPYPATSATNGSVVTFFYYSPNPDGGASWEILDGLPLGTYASGYPATQINLFSNYTRYDGTPCQTADYFAIDNVHGVHCTQAGH